MNFKEDQLQLNLKELWAITSYKCELIAVIKTTTTMCDLYQRQYNVFACIYVNLSEPAYFGILHYFDSHTK